MSFKILKVNYFFTNLTFSLIFLNGGWMISKAPTFDRLFYSLLMKHFENLINRLYNEYKYNLKTSEFISRVFQIY